MLPRYSCLSNVHIHINKNNTTQKCWYRILGHLIPIVHLTWVETIFLFQVLSAFNKKSQSKVLNYNRTEHKTGDHFAQKLGHLCYFRSSGIQAYNGMMKFHSSKLLLTIYSRPIEPISLVKRIIDGRNFITLVHWSMHTPVWWNFFFA